jgi:hypothetical protein
MPLLLSRLVNTCDKGGPISQKRVSRSRYSKLANTEASTTQTANEAAEV